ncbi:MAG: 4'-phosphopantetheinyl transferase superfamily protein [Eubacteriales bacterium]|nr:4'-phosphopantetheinyl transferase superfamily protein [Eubacteriales bacterium]
MLNIYLYSYLTFTDPYADLPVSSYRMKHFGRNEELNRKKIINEHALLYSLKQSGIDLTGACPDIRTAECGKPYIPDIGLNFNISDSGDMLLIAVSSNEIGADIEIINKDTDIDGIARRFFLREEADYLKSVSDPDLRASEFTRIWTIKEAYLKCLGTGLSGDLTSVSALNLPESYLFQTERDGDYYYTVCEKN